MFKFIRISEKILVNKNYITSVKLNNSDVTIFTSEISGNNVWFSGYNYSIGFPSENLAKEWINKNFEQ